MALKAVTVYLQVRSTDEAGTRVPLVPGAAGESFCNRGGVTQTRVATEPTPRGPHEGQGREERGTAVGGATNGHPTQTKGKTFIKEVQRIVTQILH